MIKKILLDMIVPITLITALFGLVNLDKSEVIEPNVVDGKYNLLIGGPIEKNVDLWDLGYRWGTNSYTLHDIEVGTYDILLTTSTFYEPILSYGEEISVY